MAPIFHKKTENDLYRRKNARSHLSSSSLSFDCDYEDASREREEIHTHAAIYA